MTGHHPPSYCLRIQKGKKKIFASKVLTIRFMFLLRTSLFPLGIAGIELNRAIINYSRAYCLSVVDSIWKTLTFNNENNNKKWNI